MGGLQFGILFGSILSSIAEIWGVPKRLIFTCFKLLFALVENWVELRKIWLLSKDCPENVDYFGHWNFEKMSTNSWLMSQNVIFISLFKTPSVYQFISNFFTPNEHLAPKESFDVKNRVGTQFLGVPGVPFGVPKRSVADIGQKRPLAVIQMKQNL